jgi:hypothetical protein
VPSQVTVWHAWTFAGSGKATFGFLWRAQRQFVRLAEFKGSNALINLCINVHLSPVIRRSVLRSGERATDPPSTFGLTSDLQHPPLRLHLDLQCCPPLNQGAATIAIANPLTGDAAAPSPPYRVAHPSTNLHHWDTPLSPPPPATGCLWSAESDMKPQIQGPNEPVSHSGGQLYLWFF